MGTVPSPPRVTGHCGCGTWGAAKKFVRSKAVTAVAVTHDGHCAVSASYDRALRVWNLEGGQTVCPLEGHTGFVSAVAVTPDGQRAVSASTDRTLRVWNLESGQLVRTLEGHNALVFAVAVTPDGHRAVSASYDRTLRMWDLESGEEIMAFSGESHMFRCAFAPDGRTIIAGDELGRVHFLRLVEADKTKPPTGDKDPVSAASGASRVSA